MIDSDQPIRLAIVDDHPLLLDGLCTTFSAHEKFEIVGQGATYDDALHIAKEALPDVILVDIGMPGNGIRAAEAIRSACPAVKIVMLTASESTDDVVAALRAGADGYTLKETSGPALIDIVRNVHDGKSYVAPELAGRMLVEMSDQVVGKPSDDDPLDSLTSREDQILKLVAEGLSNKEIGRQLDLQEKTVKHYMTNIMQKLQVRNRVEAALLVSGQRAR